MGTLTLPPVAASGSFLLSRSVGWASMAPHERLGLTGRRWQLADPDKRSLSFPPRVAFSWSFCMAGLPRNWLGRAWIPVASALRGSDAKTPCSYKATKHWLDSFFLEIFPECTWWTVIWSTTSWALYVFLQAFDTRGRLICRLFFSFIPLDLLL